MNLCRSIGFCSGKTIASHCGVGAEKFYSVSGGFYGFCGGFYGVITGLLRGFYASRFLSVCVEFRKKRICNVKFDKNHVPHADLLEKASKTHSFPQGLLSALITPLTRLLRCLLGYHIINTEGTLSQMGGIRLEEYIRGFY